MRFALLAAFVALAAPSIARAQASATVLDAPPGSTAVTVTVAPTGERITTWRPLRAGEGRLRVAVNRPNTEVHVDDVRVGDAPLERDLAAGTHRVRVTSPGQKAWSGTVAITAGQLTPLRVYLRPAQSLTGAWTTLTVAGVILAGSAAAGIGADLEHAALEASRAAGALDNHDPRIDTGTALAAAADIGFALGAVIAGLAVYMFAHDATPPSIARAARHERVPEAPR